MRPLPRVALVAALLPPIALAALLLAAAVDPALAAEPTPSAAVGDPRSSGEGPGLVGEPVWAILAVLSIAAVAVVATMAWIRVTGSRGPRPGPDRRSRP